MHLINVCIHIYNRPICISSMYVYTYTLGLYASHDIIALVWLSLIYVDLIVGNNPENDDVSGIFE